MQSPSRRDVASMSRLALNVHPLWWGSVVSGDFPNPGDALVPVWFKAKKWEIKGLGTPIRGVPLPKRTTKASHLTARDGRDHWHFYSSGNSLKILEPCAAGGSQWNVRLKSSQPCHWGGHWHSFYCHPLLRLFLLNCKSPVYVETIDRFILFRSVPLDFLSSSRVPHYCFIFAKTD